MIYHIQMAKKDDRAERVLGHSGLGYGTNVTPFLSRDVKDAYNNVSKSFRRAVSHRINVDNFLEIIYVYKNDGNVYESKGNSIEGFSSLTQDEFIEYTVGELLGSTDREISAYSDALRLQIVASKIPIDVKSTKKIVRELTSNLKIENVERGLELLGEYVIKKGVFEKHAFKPRKLKKPSRSKVSKSPQKRRNLKNKSKNKSKKRSAKPRPRRR
jgi:hypothetical protein